MRHTVITSSELAKDNSRLCLSAKRALGLCYQCKLYGKCESKIVDLEFEKDMRRKKEIQDKSKAQVAEINKKWEIE